jgi:hypothetical protein
MQKMSHSWFVTFIPFDHMIISQWLVSLVIKLENESIIVMKTVTKVVHLEYDCIPANIPGFCIQ